MKMLGWAKGGRLKWDLAVMSADGAEVWVGAGVEDSAEEAADTSTVPVSAVDAASASTLVTSAAPSLSAEVATSGSVGAGDVEALGCCSIGIARQSTVKISPGFNSVFGLFT